MSDPFVGEIRMFAGTFAPRGWAFCDGQLLAVSQNDALFALYGTIYGGDGRTTFGVPDLRGRVPIHQGNGAGLPNYNIGRKGGSETVALTASQVGAHTHGIDATSANGDSPVPGARRLATSPQIGGADKHLYKNATADTALDAASLPGSAGSGQAHNNIQPFLCIQFIVALFGIFPSRS